MKWAVWRGTDRTVEIKTPTIQGKVDGSCPIPNSLDVKFCKKLNAFLATLDLTTIIENNIPAAPTSKGGSIHHKSVKEVHIGYPCLSLQDTPLCSAYPNLERLIITEQDFHLFGDSSQTDRWAKTDPYKYLNKLIGGPMPKVKELKIKAVLPDEMSEGQWASNSGRMLFDGLCGMFPKLEKLELWFATPFTRDESQACMVVSPNHHNSHGITLMNRRL